MYSKISLQVSLFVWGSLMVPLVDNICTIGNNLIANGTIGKDIGANGKNGNTIGTNGTNVTNQWYHWEIPEHTHCNKLLWYSGAKPISILAVKSVLESVLE